MIELVIIYCLADDALSCLEKRTVPEVPYSSPMGCIIEGQQVAADWLKDHPSYKLNSFRCEIDKPVEREA